MAREKMFDVSIYPFRSIYPPYVQFIYFGTAKSESSERRSTADSYFACCFDGSLHSRHRCNYVSCTELINCDNVSLTRPTNVETCCNTLGLQLITFARNIDDFQSLSLFFLRLFLFLASISAIVVNSTATAMCASF